MWLRDLYEFRTLGQVVMGVLLMPAHGHLSIEGPHEFECRGCWERRMQQGCQFLRYAFLPCQGTTRISHHPLGLLQASIVHLCLDIQCVCLFLMSSIS